MTIIKQKKNLRAFLLLFIGLFFFSCKDKGTGPIPPDDKSFSVKITVKDTAGNPVSGLRVSAWEVLSIENQVGKASIPEPLSKSSKILSTTSIHFSLAARADVKLSVFNLKDQEISTLTAGILVQGSHMVTWSLPSTFPSGAYKCLLTANNDTIHFRDSIYAVYHSPDAEQNVLGWTTSDGSFEVNDPLLFPAIFDIPPFVHTNSSGPDSLGTFYYTNSVSITLTDTAAHTQQRFIVTTGSQVNTYNLVWNPTTSPTHSIARSSIILHDTVVVVPIPITTSWKLYQNYPNPFN
jgi:hypothetical protein